MKVGDKPVTYGDLARRFGTSYDAISRCARNLVDTSLAESSMIRVRGVMTPHGLLAQRSAPTQQQTCRASPRAALCCRLLKAGAILTSEPLQPSAGPHVLRRAGVVRGSLELCGPLAGFIHGAALNDGPTDALASPSGVSCALDEDSHEGAGRVAVELLVVTCTACSTASTGGSGNFWQSRRTILPIGSASLGADGVRR
jgi:hypothetical protein